MVGRVGLTVALACALSFVGWRFPTGGRISLEMVPILVLALSDGAGVGTLCGALFGALDMLLEGAVRHPIEAVLDYLVAFAVLGTAGWFSGRYRKEHRSEVAVAAVVLAVALRFVCHTVSGVLWYTAGNWTMSALFNASYLVPDAIMCALLVPQVARRVV